MRLEVQVMGRYALRVDGAEVTLGTRKGKALVAVLALDGPGSREALAPTSSGGAGRGRRAAELSQDPAPAAQPRAFLMENVPPILKTEEGAFTIEHARELGYSVTAGVLSAELFGVPQKRKRAFFLGVREGVATLPRPERGMKPKTVK